MRRMALLAAAAALFVSTGAWAQAPGKVYGLRSQM